MKHSASAPIRISTDFPLPIHVQIKDQLKMLIGLGMLQPGDSLPPAGQLAEQLQVNRNTVNAVYTQLRDEGLVLMQKGRGTAVASNPQVTAFRIRQQPLYEQARHLLTEASDKGLPLDDLLLACFAYRQLFSLQSKPEPVWLLVECKGHDHLFYRQEVERLFGIQVRIAFLDDPESSVLEAMKEADGIISTLNHADEVKSLAARIDKSVLTIGATLEPAALLQIARLNPQSTVAFVCLGKNGGEWMLRKVAEAGIDHMNSIPVGIGQTDLLQQLIHSADYLYASAAVYEQVQQLAPEKTRLYPMVLEQSSLSLLQDVRASLHS